MYPRELESSEAKPKATEFKEVKHYPYIADVIGFQEYVKLTDHEKEVLGYGTDMETLDEYILKTLEARQWEDNLESYEDIVKEMMKEAHIDEHEQAQVKLEKLMITMKFLIEQVKFNKLKREANELQI